MSAGTELLLGNADLQLAVLPGLGAGITRFDALVHGRKIPVMRPCRIDGSHCPTDPNMLACYPLLPWSNRIGQGEFEFEGRTVQIPRTRDNEAYPIHGHAWLAPWQMVSASPTAAVLMHVRPEAPFRYTAWQRYTLDGQRLSVRLTVRNDGERLPFGLGLHPFFPRTPAVTLHASAVTQWQSGKDFLPIGAKPPSTGADFARAACVSDGLNHAFSGWNGEAAIHWPEYGFSLNILAEAEHYVLFTPVGRDFFCFEPVDHPINAHRLPGGALRNGLSALDTGQRLERNFHFTIAQTGVFPFAIDQEVLK